MVSFPEVYWQLPPFQHAIPEFSRRAVMTSWPPPLRATFEVLSVYASSSLLPQPFEPLPMS